MPIDGFTTVDLGYEKGNALSKMANKFTEAFTKMYFDLFDQVWNDKSKRIRCQ
jgi:hypothetical protein